MWKGVRVASLLLYRRAQVSWYQAVAVGGLCKHLFFLITVSWKNYFFKTKTEILSVWFYKFFIAILAKAIHRKICTYIDQKVLSFKSGQTKHA